MPTQTPESSQQATIDALAARLIELATSPDEAAAKAELANLTSQIAASPPSFSRPTRSSAAPRFRAICSPWLNTTA